MEKILYAFLLFFVAAPSAYAEKLPSLKPLGHPMAIAETILDAPDDERPEPKIKEVKKTPLLEKSSIENLILSTEAISNTQPVAIAKPVIDAPIEPIKVTSVPLKPLTPQNISMLFEKLHFYGSVDANEQALHFANYILEQSPQHPRVQEALFYIATLSPDQAAQGKALQRLKVQFRDSVWAKEAAYTVIWQYAEHNKLQSLFSDKRAKELKQRQQELSNLKTVQRIATFSSLLPGAGFAYLGEYKLAVFYFIASVLLAWAFVFAIFWAQLPYALLCAFAFLSLFYNNIAEARKLAEVKVTHIWETSFNEWQDLKPLKAYQILEEKI